MIRQARVEAKASRFFGVKEDLGLFPLTNITARKYATFATYKVRPDPFASVDLVACLECSSGQRLPRNVSVIADIQQPGRRELECSS